MSTAAELRAQLDALEAEAVTLDQEIAVRRDRLAEVNAERKKLEPEFQRVYAVEEQAKLQA